MSTRPTTREDCEGKRPIRGKRAAEKAAKRLAEKEGQPMHAYWCGQCHFWHVGSTVGEPVGVKRARRRRG